MKLFKRNKLLLLGCAFLLAAVGSFGSFHYLIANNPAFVEAKNESFIRASSADEASLIAGYKVAQIGFLPQDFKVNPSIAVYDPNVIPDSTVVLPKRVMQVWSSQEMYPYIYLIQDPELDGIGNGGEDVLIHNVNGTRILTEADSKYPAILSFYWRDGDMAYALTATLTGSVDEATLIQIADSLKVD